jgi:hypothetical protein
VGSEPGGDLTQHATVVLTLWPAGALACTVLALQVTVEDSIEEREAGVCHSRYPVQKLFALITMCKRPNTVAPHSQGL